MEASNCDDHARQVNLAGTGEWVCEGCGALMDPDHPDRVLESQR